MLRRVLLSVAVVLALASVPATAELVTATTDPTSTSAPSEPRSPKVHVAREALRQSTPVMSVSNAFRRTILRLALFFAVVAAALAAAAAPARARRTLSRSPLRPGRAWASPPTRAPPAIA